MSSSHTLVARRYAEALFELAEGPGLDGVAREMEQLRTLLSENAGLRRAMFSPAVPRAAKQKAIEALAAQAGFGGLSRKFVGLVGRNNRLADLGAIAHAFLDEVADRRGLRQVEVVSARPLDEGRRAAIENSLNQALAARTVLTLRVDASLLGGLVIRIGSRLLDASVKTKLDRLGRVLQTVA